ncbi:MAG: DNA recombination protein RmuC [Euryarchaeota archaeon]|nr:DNA recombination protein RmuC [Euryarchaeota archaeon]|tara:strand:+ start:537 stop:1748 length:1212 start_codon:yes stop_codon:yes gene_type:complete
MTEAIIIVVSSCAGAFIVWFFSKKTEQVAVDNSDEVVELKVKIAKLEQQIVDLEKHKEEDAKKFEELARDVLEKATVKSQTQLEDAHSQKLKQILEPVQIQFKGFQEKVDKYYSEDLKWRGALNKELEILASANMGLNEQAENLARALKGDSKVQGDWGEYQLEKILEDVGLTKGVHFSTQDSGIDETGARKRPDFIVNLPDGKVLIIDSKVSLTAYERLVNSDDEVEKAQHLKEHIQSMRSHIRGLSKKDYSALYDRSVDYTLMFVPVEPAFFAAGPEIQSIQREGLASQVVLVSTSTIIATLRTISYIWRQEQQRNNVAAIASRGKLLYEKFVGFTKSMESIGKSLQGAEKSYTSAMKKLKTGNGSLISQAEKLRLLGLDVKETVDPKLIDTDEINEDPEE